MDRGIRIVLYLRPAQATWLRASAVIEGYSSTSEWARALLERVISEEQARDAPPPDHSQARHEQG